MSGDYWDLDEEFQTPRHIVQKLERQRKASGKRNGRKPPVPS